jgi:hypothetical protein
MIRFVQRMSVVSGEWSVLRGAFPSSREGVPFYAAHFRRLGMMIRSAQRSFIISRRRTILRGAFPSSRDDGPFCAAHFHRLQTTIRSTQRILVVSGRWTVLRSAFLSSRDDGPSFAAHFRRVEMMVCFAWRLFTIPRRRTVLRSDGPSPWSYRGADRKRRAANSCMRSNQRPSRGSLEQNRCLPNVPAQRAGRAEPRAEAEGRCPGSRGAKSLRPERPREPGLTDGQIGARVEFLATLQAAGLAGPGTLLHTSLLALLRPERGTGVSSTTPMLLCFGNAIFFDCRSLERPRHRHAPPTSGRMTPQTWWPPPACL